MEADGETKEVQVADQTLAAAIQERFDRGEDVSVEYSAQSEDIVRLAADE